MFCATFSHYIFKKTCLNIHACCLKPPTLLYAGNPFISILNSIICEVIDPRLLYYVLHWEAWELSSQDIFELFLLSVVWVTGTPSSLESSLESLYSLWSDFLTVGKNKNKFHCWSFAAYNILQDQSCNILFSQTYWSPTALHNWFILSQTTQAASFLLDIRWAPSFFRAPPLWVAFGKGWTN